MMAEELLGELDGEKNATDDDEDDGHEPGTSTKHCGIPEGEEGIGEGEAAAAQAIVPAAHALAESWNGMQGPPIHVGHW